MAPSRKGNKQTRRGFGRVELRPSGRYRAGYTGPDGKLHRAPSTFDSKTTPSRGAARRAEIRLKAWAADPLYRTEARHAVPTLKEYTQGWLKNRKTRGQPLRPTTRDHYQRTSDLGSF